MVKFLEDELKASETRHCDTCKCPNRDMTVLAILPKTYTVGTQTVPLADTNTSLCLRCNSSLNSPSRTNSPFTMKLVKSSDSVISETKSSVSDSTQNDKLFTPAKKDEIMVNPILGHHRLCDRANNIVGNKTSVNIALLSPNTSPKLNASNGTGLGESGVMMSPNGSGVILNSSSSDILNKTSPLNTSVPATTLLTSSATPILHNVASTPATTGVYLNNKDKQVNSNLLLLHSDTNDTDNEDTVNEKTSLLSNNVLLSPKSKSTSIASKLLLKSPELMGGAKPRTPEIKSPSSNNDGVRQERSGFDVEKVTSKSESLRGAGNGSTNSLWSRTSSKDGSKIFENFNRNLIKTIKVRQFSFKMIKFIISICF